LARWTHVSDRAFRVLVRMAHTALDKPGKGRPAAVYHGGRELLAMSLRGDKGSPQTRYRAVQRAVAELSEAGAIRPLKSGWAGQNAVYRLTLDGARAVDEPGRMGGQISHPEGGQFSHPMGGPSGSEWVVLETTPRNQEEPVIGASEEEGAGVGTTSHPPRASRSDENRPPKPTHCGHGLKITARGDGRPSCAFCRRGVDPPERLAKVIPLRTERAS